MKGEGRVYQRGGVWWADYTAHGHRVRVSTGKTNEKEATAWLRQRVMESASGAMSPSADKITLAELVQSYLLETADKPTSAWYRAKWVNHLEPFFGNVKAVAVNTDMVRRYIAHRQKEKTGWHGQKPTNGTINRELQVLTGSLNLGKKEGKVRVVPHIPHLTEDNIRTGFLEDEKHDKLASECNKVGLWLRAMFELAYTYGWRRSEISRLKVSQVDLMRRTIRLEPGRMTKNRQGRTIVMTSAVHSLLSACITGKQPNDLVFTREGGKPVKDFAKAWKNACTAAGVPGLLFHDLRRTAVRNMVRSGVSEKVAMTISGHKTRSVFDRYHIVDERDLKEAVAKLESPSGTLTAQTAHPHPAKSPIM